MTAFAVLVKSHRPDLPYAQRLVDSIRRHNADGVDVHLAVPSADVDAFEPLTGGAVRLFEEEQLATHLVSAPVAGFSPGYINQEIVKLAFWEAGLADNYLCVDSDLEFVRDFHVDDFMADATTPYTFLTEDAALRSEPAYYAEHWVERERKLRLIQKEVGLDSERLLTVHGHAVFSSTVLCAFRDRFLAPRGWDYRDALAIAPYEPTWYSQWLLKDRTIPVVMREPIVKTFHNQTQYLDYVVRRVDADDVARGYVAVIINSNFSRGEGLLALGEPAPDALARDVPAHRLVGAMLSRVIRPVRSVASRTTSSGVTGSLSQQLSRKRGS